MSGEDERWDEPTSDMFLMSLEAARAFFDKEGPQPTKLIVSERLRRSPKVRRYLRHYPFKHVWLSQPKFRARSIA